MFQTFADAQHQEPAFEHLFGPNRADQISMFCREPVVVGDGGDSGGNDGGETIGR